MASVCLVNHYRAVNGLPSIYVDVRLQRAAEGHAHDMANRGYFSHMSPEGCSPSCRAEQQGYPGSSGENIAWGYYTATKAVAGWIGSPGHRDNILTEAYWTMGAGLAAQGGRLWVHALVRSRRKTEL